ncbi:YqeB family protein [Streptomyces marincola]|uniref:YqeB family protein n=1 Tax=Streptomyces marincola TaxID=2878388 RepID=UPI001CF51537|nr:hypothetical protein [Streptomyces marincola]UCM90914.1 hypothetical protein LC193_24875 [Streptomyces marincola]
MRRTGDPGHEGGAAVGGDATVLGLPARDRWLLVAGAPALGALAGAAAPFAAAWAADRPWAPFGGPLELIASFDRSWSFVVLGAVGLLLGAAFAVFALASCLRVTLAGDEVRLDKDGRTRYLERPCVAAVFTDGRQLVILAQDSRELLREDYEGGAARLARGFRAHGYPWAGESDPHAELYRRWVPDTPDLPAGVNAVLAARDKALRKKQDRDAADLRAEVQKLGIVVRDRERRQYWRPLVPAP